MMRHTAAANQHRIHEIAPSIEVLAGTVRRAPIFSRASVPIQVGTAHVDSQREKRPTVPSSAFERREWEWTGTSASLIAFHPSARAEIEVGRQNRAVLMRCEGASTELVWTDSSGRQTPLLARPDTVIYLPPGACRTISMSFERPSQLLLLEMDPDAGGWLPPQDPAAGRFHSPQASLIEDGEVLRTMTTIRNELMHPGQFDDLYCERLTALLIVQLLRAGSTDAGQRERRRRRGGLPGWRLRRALELLDANLDSAPKLDEVARQVGFSGSHFSRAFKLSMGMPPHQYLIRRRIEEAMALMTDHRLNLTEIALRCGFNGSSQFSTVFRRATGMSPSMYRRELAWACVQDAGVKPAGKGTGPNG